MSVPGSSAWRREHWRSCEKADIVTRPFGPKQIRLTVARHAVEATEVLLDTCAAFGYVVRQKVTGAYNCRKITGGSVLSAHGFGLAVDINWDTNPYVKGRLVTDMPVDMVNAIEGVRTRGDVKVWRWGGNWDGRPETPHQFYDAMHWEIIATPLELQAGIDRTIDQALAAGMPVLRKGHGGPAVLQLQELLNANGYPVTPSGQFLDVSDRQVRAYQTSRGLKSDGRVGPATWTALLNALPPLPKGGIKPSKAEL